MTRQKYTENYRTMEAAMKRSSVDAAYAGIMCLNHDDLRELQARLETRSAKTINTKIQLVITEREAK